MALKIKEYRNEGPHPDPYKNVVLTTSELEMKKLILIQKWMQHEVWNMVYCLFWSLEHVNSDFFSFCSEATIAVV